MKKQLRTLTALGAVLALCAACGQAKAGRALPDGDQAATYVSAKFQKAMEAMDETLGKQRNTTTSFDTYFRIDDKWAHNTVTASRQGTPESKITRNKSVKKPDQYQNTYSPAKDPLDYVEIGPGFKDAAPTSWVSMPKAKITVSCGWGGIISACHMTQAVARAYNANNKVVTKAKSLPGGKTELTADVTLGAFLDAKVEQLPSSLSALISDEMRKEVVPTKVVINADNTLDQIVMDAKIDKSGHHVELHEEFHVTGAASPNDFPALPDPSQITPLPDKAAVDAFYDKLSGGK